MEGKNLKIKIFAKNATSIIALISLLALVGYFYSHEERLLDFAVQTVQWLLIASVLIVIFKNLPRIL